MRSPIPRVLSHRMRGADGHPSRPDVAARLQQPTRRLGRAALKRLLLGLAPDEACHAADCYQRPGGLLHRRFTLTYRSKPISGLFSAALSLRSPWADVIRHRALWSPEVPQPTDRSRPSRGLKCTMIARKRTKGKSKKLYFSCVNFSVKSQCCGYNVDYRTAKQLFGPYIAGNTA